MTPGERDTAIAALMRVRSRIEESRDKIAWTRDLMRIPASDPRFSASLRVSGEACDIIDLEIAALRGERKRHG